MTERKNVSTTPFQKSLSSTNFQRVVVGDSASTSNFQSVAPKAPAGGTTSGATSGNAASTTTSKK